MLEPHKIELNFRLQIQNGRAGIRPQSILGSRSIPAHQADNYVICSFSEACERNKISIIILVFAAI